LLFHDRLLYDYRTTFISPIPYQKLFIPTICPLLCATIFIYKKRWAIEEVHCQMKQSMKWETMRLGSYQGRKNLNAFMALALIFIYVSKKYIEKSLLDSPNYYTTKKKTYLYLKNSYTTE